jgi:hypothetical protein
MTLAKAMSKVSKRRQSAFVEGFFFGSANLVFGLEPVVEIRAGLHPQIVSAVMNAWDLAELDRVDQKRYVAMPRQPDSVVLIIHFCAPWSRGMTAEVNHRGQPPPDVLREVKVPRYIEARHGLKLDLFDAVSVRSNCPVMWAASGVFFGIGSRPSM